MPFCYIVDWVPFYDIVELSRLCCDIVELKAKHKKMSDEKSLETAHLSEQLRLREATIKQMKDEDAQRASILTNAIQSYVTRSPYNQWPQDTLHATVGFIQVHLQATAYLKKSSQLISNLQGYYTVTLC